MRTIDQGIRDAIKAVTTRPVGTQANLSRAAGVAQQNINRYLSGEIQRISDENWFKLLPHIRAHLPKDHPALQATAPGCPSGLTLGMTCQVADCPLDDCPAKGIPHEPLTQELLNDWKSLSKMERLEALTAISEIRAKKSAASGA